MAKNKQPAAPAVDKRYFAQVGSELIEVPAEEVALHADGAPFSTSKPILHYQVRAQVGEDVYVGAGSSWATADAAVNEQLPKAVQS